MVKRNQKDLPGLLAQVYSSQACSAQGDHGT